MRGGGGREGGFQNGIRSWLSSLRQSLSIFEGMLCCGGRSSPRGLSTGTTWADGWAGGLLRSWSTFGCARTAEGSTATGVLCRRKPTTLATRRSCSTRRSPCVRERPSSCLTVTRCCAGAGDDPSLWRDRNSASGDHGKQLSLTNLPSQKNKKSAYKSAQQKRNNSAYKCNYNTNQPTIKIWIHQPP